MTSPPSSEQDDSFEIIDPPETAQKQRSSKNQQQKNVRNEDAARISDPATQLQRRPYHLDDVLVFSTLFDFALSSFALGFFVHARNPLLTAFSLSSTLITLLTMFSFKAEHKKFKLGLKCYFLMITVRYSICVLSIHQIPIVILLTPITIAHAWLIAYCINKQFMKKIQSHIDGQTIFEWSTLFDFACSMFAVGFFVTDNQLFAAVFMAPCLVAILTIMEYRHNEYIRNLKLYFFIVTARYGICLPAIHSQSLAILATLVTVAQAGLIYYCIDHRKHKMLEDDAKVDAQKENGDAQTTMEMEKAETFKKRLETLEQLERVNGFNVVNLCRYSVVYEICFSLYFLGYFVAISSQPYIPTVILSVICILSTLLHYFILHLFKERKTESMSLHCCFIIIVRMPFIIHNWSHGYPSYWLLSIIIVILMARVALALQCHGIFLEIEILVDDFYVEDVLKVHPKATMKDFDDGTFTRKAKRKKIVGRFPAS